MKLSADFHQRMCPLVQVLCTQLHPHFQAGNYCETTDSCSLKTLGFFEQYFSFCCTAIQGSLDTHKSLISKDNGNSVFQIVSSPTKLNTLFLALKITAKIIFLSSAFNIEKHTERGSMPSFSNSYRSHYKSPTRQNFYKVMYWCYSGVGWHQKVDSSTVFQEDKNPNIYKVEYFFPLSTTKMLVCSGLG